MEGEAYFDVVWKQLRKNRMAVRMLWVVAALLLVGIFAPLIASNQPLWFREKDGTLHFPWWVMLFNPETEIDLIFNLALLAFFPWLAGSLYFNRTWKARGAPGRRRVARVVVAIFALLAFASMLVYSVRLSSPEFRFVLKCILIALGIGSGVVLSRRETLPKAMAASGGLLLLIVVFFFVGIPANKYFSRDFRRDQQEGRGSGTYTFIPYGPFEVDLDTVYKKPFFRKQTAPARYRDGDLHLMGTDDSGRDVLVRLVYGTRISITIGIVAVSIYLTIGVCIGAIAGYFGGRIDMIISRVIEIVLLFPSFFLILTLVALIGPSIYIIMVVIGLTGWPTVARLTRGEFLKQRSIDYVAAARGLGAPDSRVIFRHILPNALSPAFVSAPFGIAGAIVTEATLSVLGFGARPPAPSWGAILNLSVQNYDQWWFTVFAGFSIFITMTVFNVVGNGLRDAMDPRLKGTQ